MADLLGFVLLLLVGQASAPVGSYSPVGRVVANAVNHAGRPAVEVKVPATAIYAGVTRFPLYGVADAEIHAFIEADEQRRVRRLYWIQFESYLPDRPDHRYEYGANDRRMDGWGAPVWVRTFLSNTQRPARAGSDSESVRSIVARAGYRLPPEMMMARLVRLLDDPQGSGYGRSELMLIYAEDLAPSGFSIADLTAADGEANANWPPLEAPLIERAKAAFSVASTKATSAQND